MALAGVMGDDDSLKPLGGASYLIRLVGSVLTPSMAQDYAMLMVEHACRRRLRVLAKDVASGLNDGG